MQWKRVAVLFLFPVLALSGALAQKVDVGFVVGGSITSDTKGSFSCPPGVFCVLPQPVTENFRTGHQFFFQGEGAYRLTDAKVASLYIELPVVGIPSQRVTLTGFCCTLEHVTTTFVTPSLRFKLLPKAPVSPFVSVGAGWARYSISRSVENKGALQYGGGVDVKTPFPHVAVRFEVRDFLTGDPGFSFINSSLSGQGGLHHHNVLPGGGVVFNF
jgi:hypothetical protein